MLEKRELQLKLSESNVVLMEKIDDMIIEHWKLDRKEVEQSLVTVRVLNDLKEYLYTAIKDEKDYIDSFEISSSCGGTDDYLLEQATGRLNMIKLIANKINELEEQYKCSQ